jgi:hypothetical protein
MCRQADGDAGRRSSGGVGPRPRSHSRVLERQDVTWPSKCEPPKAHPRAFYREHLAGTRTGARASACDSPRCWYRPDQSTPRARHNRGGRQVEKESELWIDEMLRAVADRAGKRLRGEPHGPTVIYREVDGKMQRTNQLDPD